MYNRQYNTNSETELVNMPQDGTVMIKPRPFDWFICSVLGYLCCPVFGICAIYYAVRANHAVDWERQDDLIVNHTRKAKCLSLTSIGLGVVMLIIAIILIVVIVNQLQSAITSAMGSMSSIRDQQSSYYG